MVILMVNNKVHVCIIDNGVFCGQVHLYKNMEVVGNEIRLVISEVINCRMDHPVPK